MDQPGLAAPFGKNSFNPFFFAKGFVFANEFDLDIQLGSQCFGIDTNFIASGFRPLWKIKEADVFLVKEVLHRSCIGYIRQRTVDDNSVKTGNNTGYVGLVAVNERIHLITRYDYWFIVHKS